MNWMIKLGQWWERRRVVRYPEFEASLKAVHEILKSHETSNAVKELQAIKIRLDRIELLVGLKREPVALQVPGAAKIS